MLCTTTHFHTYSHSTSNGCHSLTRADGYLKILHDIDHSVVLYQWTAFDFTCRGCGDIAILVWRPLHRGGSKTPSRPGRKGFPPSSGLCSQLGAAGRPMCIAPAAVVFHHLKLNSNGCHSLTRASGDLKILQDIDHRVVLCQCKAFDFICRGCGAIAIQLQKVVIP